MDTNSKEALRTLLKGIVFALPLLAVLVFIEHGLRKVRHPYSVARAHADVGAANCEVLILGSSNAAWGIAPDELQEPAVNLANMLGTLYYDLALAERYLPRMPRVKIVILPLGFATLQGELYDVTTEADRPFWFSQLWEIPPQGDTFFSGRRWSLTALYGVRKAIYFARTSFDVDPTYHPPFTLRSQQRLAKEAQDLAVAHNAMIRPGHVPDNLGRLDRIATLAKLQGAKFVLLETPAQDIYLRHLSPALVAINQRATEEFLAAHPGIQHRDYRRDSRFGPADFLDAAHLNPSGAKKFARLLDSEVIQPLLARP